MRLISFVAVLFLSCSGISNPPPKTFDDYLPQPAIGPSKKFDEQSWQYFLQHLPVKKGVVVDYKGDAVANQLKQDGIIQFDVGTSDLQQCADALMRIRAEYLFGQKRYNEIAFHFVDGTYYTYEAYCKGMRIVPGKKISFIPLDPCSKTHETLRKYLNVLYTFASTISLAKELKKTDDFAVGTVIIYPGSPGHCFIITDEATDDSGEKVFKLVEGYSPAQSIYVLSNLEEPGINPWYHLHKGIIRTASCEFRSYQLGQFE